MTDTAPTKSRELLAAVGIAVSDMARSVDFYTRVFGLVQLQTFSLPNMEEVVVGFAGSRSAAIVLMHYTDGTEPNTKDNPIKLVFRIEDPVALAAAIKADGLEIVREPTPIPEMGNALVGFAKDPDGYLLELLQR